MLGGKQAEEVIVSTFNEAENDGGGGKDAAELAEDQPIFNVKNAFWHGGSAWDAWFSCSSNQVAQVLLALPNSFSQLGMLSGIIFQVFYGLIGSWTAYLISVLYIECRSRKEKEGVSFKNHVIQKPAPGKYPLRLLGLTPGGAGTPTILEEATLNYLQVDMIAQIAVGVLVGCVGYAYFAIQPLPPKICGTPGGPPVTSSRVKLDDGRHLSYKERGVAKEEAKHKIIISHGFADSKEFNINLSDELMKELSIYILSFDRAGYGESDPNPARSVKSEAFDIQELADKLGLGPKFYVIGISMGAYPAYSCLNYIPHRLSGVALVVPFVHYWWKSVPAELSKEALGRLPVPDQWTFRVAHYTPWLLNWWMTQKWFTSLSIAAGKLDVFSPSDLEIIKQLPETPKEDKERVTQQGVHECLHRDVMVGFGDWEFDPTELSNPFPNNDGSVHLWQGYEDKYIPYKLNRYLSQQLPWIQCHEVSDYGHLLIYNATLCEAVFRALLSA